MIRISSKGEKKSKSLKGKTIWHPTSWFPNTHTHTLGTEFMKITSDNGEIESTIFMIQFNEGYYLSLVYQTVFGVPKIMNQTLLAWGVKCDAEISQWTSHFFLFSLCVSITFPHIVDVLFVSLPG